MKIIGIYYHHAIQLIGLLVTLIGSTVVQYESNGWLGLVQKNQKTQTEAILSDIWYLTRDIACKAHSLNLPNIECGKGVWQNESLSAANRFEAQNTEAAKRAQISLISWLLLGGYVFWLGLLVQYRRDFKLAQIAIEKENDKQNSRNQIEAWLTALSIDDNVRIYVKSRKE